MQYFEKNNKPERLFLSEIIDWKKWGNLNAQQVKRLETVQESARQYFCQIFWSLWKKIRSKNSVLVVSLILKQITYETHLFFKVFEIWWRFRISRKKIQKIFFHFEIIAFEMVSLNTRFHWLRIVVIRSQYVNQQS